MKIIVLAVAIGAASVAFAVAPLSQAARPFKGLFSGEKREGVAEVKLAALRHWLNFRQETPLSAEQKEKLASVLKSHRDELKALFKRGHEVREAMRDTAIAKGPDDAATKSAADAVGNLARDRALLLARIGSEVRPLFSEEQVKRLEAARAEIEPMVEEMLEKMAKAE